MPYICVKLPDLRIHYTMSANKSQEQISLNFLQKTIIFNIQINIKKTLTFIVSASEFIYIFHHQTVPTFHHVIHSEHICIYLPYILYQFQMPVRNLHPALITARKPEN